MTKIESGSEIEIKSKFKFFKIPVFEDAFKPVLEDVKKSSASAW